ncbi:MAG: patatin-like phospholipase family protein [Anaerolineae bacterium]|nr:patatin-like phospholipase family protein [Anaerolineae bacterium]
MKPLRQNVALAVDGGGIKGVLVTEALKTVEEAAGKPINELFSLTAGTSTGSLIAAGVAHGLDASAISDIYVEMGPKIFRKSWRTLPLIEYLVNYRYGTEPLEEILAQHLGDMTVGQLHQQRPDFNMVITTTDLYACTTRFLKLYKQRFADWRLRDAVLASCIVPTVFPAFEHDYNKQPDDPPQEAWIPKRRYWVDGGVGSYCNPCYMAAYEIAFCLREKGWQLDNTTLISIGTGKDPMQQTWKARLRNIFGMQRKPTGLLGPEWIFPSVDIFLHDANLEQTRLVRHFFCDAVAERAGDPDAGLDFRRFDIDLDEAIALDDINKIPALIEYGKKLGEMIVNDRQEDVGSFGCGDSTAITSRGSNQKRIEAI